MRVFSIQIDVTCADTLEPKIAQAIGQGIKSYALLSIRQKMGELISADETLLQPKYDFGVSVKELK